MPQEANKGKYDVIKAYAVLDNTGVLKPWQYTARPLGQDDVEIEISHCGICHGDCHFALNEFGISHFPLVPGHEIVGLITAAGNGVTALKVGDRVGVGFQCDSCNNCHLCNASKDHYCGQKVNTMSSNYKSDGKPTFGGFAEAVRVPSRYAFKIPDNLKSEDAAPLLCAGITVYRPLKKFMFPNCKVGVVGIGGLGHLALQYAKKLGATEVVAISTSDAKKDEAFKLGATATVNSRNPAAASQWKGKLDLIICTATASSLPWDFYLSLLGVEGRIVVLGLAATTMNLPIFDVVLRGLQVGGSIIGSRGEIEEMLEYSAKMDIKPWVEVMPMEKCNEGLKRVVDNEARYRFVLETSRKL